MKMFYAVLFLAALGFWGVQSFQSDAEGQAGTPVQSASPNSYALPAVSREEYARRELPNGTIVFERINPSAPQVAAHENLDAIAPAAGSREPQVRYEPLTQTFRRTVIDSEGNSRQEIIRHPANR